MPSSSRRISTRDTICIVGAASNHPEVNYPVGFHDRKPFPGHVRQNLGAHRIPILTARTADDDLLSLDQPRPWMARFGYVVMCERSRSCSVYCGGNPAMPKAVFRLRRAAGDGAHTRADVAVGSPN